MWHDPPTTLERVDTARGELALRRSGNRFEIISNGVFLMDTSDGDIGTAAHRGRGRTMRRPGPRVLIGGLGVGFSLSRAVEHAHLGDRRGGDRAGGHRLARALSRDDQRRGHARSESRSPPGRHDRLAEHDDGNGGPATTCICLDTDNGPNWLVFDSNAELYHARGSAWRMTA